jgi:hypothetical protein
MLCESRVRSHTGWLVRTKLVRTTPNIARPSATHWRIAFNPRIGSLREAPTSSFVITLCSPSAPQRSGFRCAIAADPRGDHCDRSCRETGRMLCHSRGCSPRRLARATRKCKNSSRPARSHPSCRADAADQGWDYHFHVESDGLVPQ